LNYNNQQGTTEVLAAEFKLKCSLLDLKDMEYIAQDLKWLLVGKESSCIPYLLDKQCMHLLEKAHIDLQYMLLWYSNQLKP
jgi:hypothetical protein